MFGQEIEALAKRLRAQGFDARADPSSSTIEVGTQGRGEDAGAVRIELRPDRYRQYLDELETDFEAIGGDPRARAWAHWWWTIAHALMYGFAEPVADLRRLSFLRSDEGQVALFANAVGDEPPEPQYVWTAERGH